MTIEQAAILLGLGALHSASLWAITSAFNTAARASNRHPPDWLLRTIPAALGIPSAHYGFPLALHLAGIDAHEVHPAVSVVLGLAAAAGAEGTYRAATTLLPRLTTVLLDRVEK